MCLPWKRPYLTTISSATTAACGVIQFICAIKIIVKAEIKNNKTEILCNTGSLLDQSVQAQDFKLKIKRKGVKSNNLGVKKPQDRSLRMRVCGFQLYTHCVVLATTEREGSLVEDKEHPLQDINADIIVS